MALSNNKSGNGVVWKVTIGMLISALLTLMSTTMVARAGMPTTEEVVTIVESKTGKFTTQLEVATAVMSVREDVQKLTLEVGKLIGRLESLDKIRWTNER